MSDIQGLKDERKAYEEWHRAVYQSTLYCESRWEAWKARAAVDRSSLEAVPDVDDLKDRLVAISDAVANSDDREAQAIIRTTLEMLSAAPAQPAQHQPNYLEMVYGFLCSTSPEGFADEAFRVVPEGVLPLEVRNRISQSRNAVGNDAATLSGHAGAAPRSSEETGCSVATQANTDQPAQQEHQPMTEETMREGFSKCRIDGLNSRIGFSDGVKFAERHHGIRKG